MNIATTLKTALFVAAMGVLASGSIAQAEPKPVPHKFLYDFGAGIQESTRAASVLQDFKRKATLEGWEVVQSEAQTYTKHVEVYKAKGTSIESLVVDRLKGCEHFDSDCRRYVGNLNRRKVDDISQLDYEGDVLLPAQATRYVITVDAKNHYKEEFVAVPGQTQLQLVATMSSEFNKALAPLRPYTIAGWASFCNGAGCIQLYELKVQ